MGQQPCALSNMALTKALTLLALLGVSCACEWHVSMDVKAGVYTPQCSFDNSECELSDNFKAYQELPMLTERNTMVCMRFGDGEVTECANVGRRDLTGGDVDTSEPCSAGCPEGFTRVGDSCYRVTPGKNNYWDSKAFCRDNYNAQLAEIESAEQNAAVAEFLKDNHPGVSPYFGLNDQDEEGIYHYPGKKEATFFNWFSGEPNNKGNEDCMLIKSNKSFKWVDIRCNKKFQALCQFKPTY